MRRRGACAIDCQRRSGWWASRCTWISTPSASSWPRHRYHGNRGAARRDGRREPVRVGGTGGDIRRRSPDRPAPRRHDYRCRRLPPRRGRRLAGTPAQQAHGSSLAPLLRSRRGGWGWSLFGVVGFLALFGIVLEATARQRPNSHPVPWRQSGYVVFSAANSASYVHRSAAVGVHVVHVASLARGEEDRGPVGRPTTPVFVIVR